MEKETIKLMTTAALFSPSNFNLQVQNYNFTTKFSSTNRIKIQHSVTQNCKSL